MDTHIRSAPVARVRLADQVGVPFLGELADRFRALNAMLAVSQATSWTWANLDDLPDRLFAPLTYAGGVASAATEFRHWAAAERELADFASHASGVYGLDSGRGVFATSDWIRTTRVELQRLTHETDRWKPLADAPDIEKAIQLLPDGAWNGPRDLPTMPSVDALLKGLLSTALRSAMDASHAARVAVEGLTAAMPDTPLEGNPRSAGDEGRARGTRAASTAFALTERACDECIFALAAIADHRPRVVRLRKESPTEIVIALLGASGAVIAIWDKLLDIEVKHASRGLRKEAENARLERAIAEDREAAEACQRLKVAFNDVGSSSEVPIENVTVFDSIDDLRSESS